MQMRMIGLNHDTAPVAVRGRLAFAPEEIGEALDAIRRHPDIAEAVLLSTCNRTELYLVGDIDSARDWLLAFKGVHGPDIEQSLYRHEGAAAVRHLMQVAAGLDSMILGEPQILGQVKDAYARACECGTVSAALRYFFQQAFAVAKDVRTRTAIGANAVSVAYAAVQLSRHIFSEVCETTCLLVGAGEMMDLVARHLSEMGVSRLIIANRTLERAQALAGQYRAQAVTLNHLPEVLAQADMVFSSTASMLPIIGKGMVERAMKERRYQPMLFVDMAVPPDVEAEVADIEEVFLYSVDDLRNVVEENLRARQQAATEADAIIDVHLQRIDSEQRQADGVDVVKVYRQQLEVWRDEFQGRALAELQKGVAPSEVFERLTRQLVNRISHHPTVALKRASEQGRHDLLAWALELLTDADMANAESNGESHGKSDAAYTAEAPSSTTESGSGK